MTTNKKAIEVIGRFGKWQVWQMLILWTPSFLQGYFTGVRYVTTLSPTGARCVPKNCTSLSPSIEEGWSSAEMMRILYPERVFLHHMETGTTHILRTLDQCKTYNPTLTADGSCNWNQTTAYPFNEIFCSDIHRFYFKRTMLGESLITEFNLICHRSHYAIVLVVLEFIGGGVGTLILQVLSDAFGRRITINGAVAVSILAHILGSAMPNLSSYGFALFFMSFGSTGSYFLAFCSLMEMLYSNKRFKFFYWMSPVTLVGILYPLTYSVGAIVACLLGYFFADSLNWRQFELYFSLATLPFLPYMYYVTPESFRWLLMRKQYQEARKIIHDIARYQEKEHLLLLKDIKTIPRCLNNLTIHDDKKDKENDERMKNCEPVVSSSESETSSDDDVDSWSNNEEFTPEITSESMQEEFSNLTKIGTQFIGLEGSGGNKCIGFVAQPAPPESSDLEELRLKTKAYTFRDLFGHYLRCYTYIFCTLSFTVQLIYQLFDKELEMSLGEKSHQIFELRALSFACEIPAVLFIVFFEGLFGRRLLLGSLLFLCFILLFISRISRLNLEIIALLFSAKGSVYGATTILYLYILTLYPTAIRNLAFACFICFGYCTHAVFEIIYPVMVETGGRDDLSSVAVIICLGSALVAWLLPETINDPLPETVEDIRFNVRNNNYGICICCVGDEKENMKLPIALKAKPFPKEIRWASGSTKTIQEFRTKRFGVDDLLDDTYLTWKND